MDKTLLEVSRLEKRLTKLTQLLANPVPEAPLSPSSILWSFSVGKTQRKQLEQSVVAWEDDASVARCPFCQQEFSTYTFRRHHCRLCGRVVCGDPLTDCSAEVGLNVAAGMGLAFGPKFSVIVTPEQDPINQQRNLVVRSALTSGCVKNVRRSRSASKILPNPLRTSRQMFEPMKTWYSSNEA